MMDRSNVNVMPAKDCLTHLILFTSDDIQICTLLSNDSITDTQIYDRIRKKSNQTTTNVCPTTGRT